MLAPDHVLLPRTCLQVTLCKKQLQCRHGRRRPQPPASRRTPLRPHSRQQPVTSSQPANSFRLLTSRASTGYHSGVQPLLHRPQGAAGRHCRNLLHRAMIRPTREHCTLARAWPVFKRSGSSLECAIRSRQAGMLPHTAIGGGPVRSFPARTPQPICNRLCNSTLRSAVQGNRASPLLRIANDWHARVGLRPCNTK